MQDSVWITPDPIDSVLEKLSREGRDPRSLVTWEVQPSAGEKDKRLVGSAWKLEVINEGYRAYLEQLGVCPFDDASGLEAMGAWLREERRAWLGAVSVDPLLPGELLPAGYLGKVAWEKRQEVMRRFQARLMGEGKEG
jgi:DNA-binding transcriptional regulator PaaX